MTFNKVKFTFVSSYLLGLGIRVYLSQITLFDKAQNGDGVCLVTERVKIGPLEVAAEKGSSKVLQNMMHGLVGGQGTDSLGHILGDLVENCSENVDRRDGSDQSGLKENVLHHLSIFGNTRVDKRSRGRKINGPSNQKKLKHVIVELGLSFTGLIFARFNNDVLRSLLDCHHLCSKLLHETLRIKRLLIICRCLLGGSGIWEDDGQGGLDVGICSNILKGTTGGGRGGAS
jgi:hypothetical protein